MVRKRVEVRLVFTHPKCGSGAITVGQLVGQWQRKWPPLPMKSVFSPDFYGTTWGGVRGPEGPAPPRLS